MLESFAFLETPEIREAPELMEQHGRHDTESREQECRRTVMPARHDANRCDGFDQNREHEQRARQDHAAGLPQRCRPVQNLVERTERKQHDQADPQQQRQVLVDDVHGGWPVATREA